MGLNYDALEGMDKELNVGGGGYLNQGDIDPTMDIRLMPPQEGMNGLPYLKIHLWWIDGKKFISPETFGEVCPITEAVTAAEEMAKTDPSLKDILNAKAQYGKKLEKKIECWAGVLQFKLDNPNNPDSPYSVVDEEWKVLQMGKMLTSAVNAVLLDRFSRPDPTDMVVGKNIILKKTKKNNRTQYTATGWDGKQDLTAFSDLYQPDRFRDIVGLVREQMATDQEMQEEINQYLYGGAHPAGSVGQRSAAPVAGSRRMTAQRAAQPQATPAEQSQPAAQTQPVPSTGGGTKTVTRRKGRDMTDDLPDGSTDSEDAPY